MAWIFILLLILGGGVPGTSYAELETINNIIYNIPSDLTRIPSRLRQIPHRHRYPHMEHDMSMLIKALINFISMEQQSSSESYESSDSYETDESYEGNGSYEKYDSEESYESTYSESSESSSGYESSESTNESSESISSSYESYEISNIYEEDRDCELCQEKDESDEHNIKVESSTRLIVGGRGGDYIKTFLTSLPSKHFEKAAEKDGEANSKALQTNQEIDVKEDEQNRTDVKDKKPENEVDVQSTAQKDSKSEGVPENSDERVNSIEDENESNSLEEKKIGRKAHEFQESSLEEEEDTTFKPMFYSYQKRHEYRKIGEQMEKSPDGIPDN